MVSELYNRFGPSARVLERMGFEYLERVPLSMHAHAHAADPVRPVHHFALSPWHLPSCARVLLDVLNGAAAPRGDLTFDFSAYNLESRGTRAMIEKLAQGDLSMIGHSGPAPFDLGHWLALHGMEQVMDFGEFRAQVADATVGTSLA